MRKTILVVSAFLIGFVVSAQEVKKADLVNATQEVKKEVQKEETKQADATIDFESKV